MNSDAFRAWLEDAGYRPQTIRHTLYGARQVLDGDVAPRLRDAAKRLRAFLAEHGGETAEAKARIDAVLATPERRTGLRGGKKRKRRKNEARSFSDADWQRLCGALRVRSDPDMIVLDIMASTGLRIGDVLGVTKKAFDAAQKSGVLVLEQKGGVERFVPLDGAAEAWAKLARAWSESRAGNVAKLVSPRGNGSVTSSGAAYRKVLRALKELAEELAIDERVYTHRFRRTVGVQALRVTEDIIAVSQLLGHASTQATLGYLDEARPDRIAALQQQIRKRFAEEEET